MPGGCVGSGVDRCRSLLAARSLTAAVTSVDSARPPGVVLEVRPGPGAVASTDQPVTLLVSNGARWTPPPPPEPEPTPEPEPEPETETETTPEPDPAAEIPPDDSAPVSESEPPGTVATPEGGTRGGG